MKKILILILIFTLVVCCTMSSDIAYAQSEIKCGDVVDSEFTKPLEIHKFVIELKAGDQISVSALPLGDTLKLGIMIYGPTGLGVANSDNISFDFLTNPVKAPIATSGILSASGRYTIATGNSRITLRRQGAENYDDPAGIGLYTLSVSCTKRDGTVIKPGDTIQPTQPSPSNLSQPPAFGFPGLAPVDFKDALELPFIEGQPIITAIAGKVVFMSKLTATAGETYAVNVARTSGTASLGLTVLDPSNVAVFNVAMGTMDSFTANIKITANGVYTLGFYNAPLVAGGENTAGAYTITVTKQ